MQPSHVQGSKKELLTKYVPKQNLSTRFTRRRPAMRWKELEDQACSVARTVSVIGDRWTLLILRDCFLRVRRFEEFQSKLGITRHLLAERLKKLLGFGV